MLKELLTNSDGSLALIRGSLRVMIRSLPVHRFLLSVQTSSRTRMPDFPACERVRQKSTTDVKVRVTGVGKIMDRTASMKGMSKNARGRPPHPDQLTPA